MELYDLLIIGPTNALLPCKHQALPNQYWFAPDWF